MKCLIYCRCFVPALLIIFTILTAVNALRGNLLRDEIFYITSTRHDYSWSDSREKMKNMPPLVPSILRSAGALGVSVRVIGTAFSIGCGLLFLLCVYNATLLIFDNVAFARISLFISAFHYYVIDLSGRVLRDGPYLAFFALTMCFAIASFQKKGRQRFYCWIMAYAFAPVCVLVRREGIEVYFILTGALLFEMFRNYRNRRVLFEWATIGIIGTLIFIGEAWVASLATGAGGYEWDVISALWKRMDFIRRVWKFF